MKALVCEMCSSPNLIKKDGMYVCENCGTRYTIEEARNILRIDGSDNDDEITALVAALPDYLYHTTGYMSDGGV